MKHVTLALGALLAAGATAGAQQRPEIRPLGAVVAVADSFAAIADVRHLSNGSVLVNDVPGRRVVLLDEALRPKATVADSTPATGTAYSGQRAGLIAWRGDSTLFTDPQSMSMLVIDPDGKVARTMAVPRSQDAGQLVGSTMGRPGFDARGRLVYREGMSFRPMMMSGGGGAPSMPQMPDSQPVVRVDLTTRRVDTVGMVKVPSMRMSMTENEGRMMMRSVVDPLPVVDDWVVLPDGSVAFIRGRDYRIEWVDAEGRKTSSRRIPFEWQRLSDDDKVAFIDSVRVARERITAEMQARAATGDRAGATAGMAGALGGGSGGGGGVDRVSIVVSGGGGGGGGGAGPAASGGSGPPAGLRMPPVEFIDPMELPDYKPAFFAGAARADMEGNIWIRTIPTRAIPGGPVYDVIDRQGELVERVQIPEGRTIIGFGTGGVVYMTAREGGVMRLEKAMR